MNDDLLTTAQVASALGIGIQSVYKADQRGTINPVRRLGNQNLYSLREVERYRKMHSRASRKIGKEN
jgi:predicted site-specific integrase-resolvase